MPDRDEVSAGRRTRRLRGRGRRRLQGESKQMTQDFRKSGVRLTPWGLSAVGRSSEMLA